MFKNLLSFWKGKDFLTQVIDEFGNMLNDAEGMFRSVCNKLLKNEEQPDLEKKSMKLTRK